MQREGGVSALESLVDLNEAISCNFQVASVVGGGGTTTTRVYYS